MTFHNVKWKGNGCTLSLYLYNYTSIGYYQAIIHKLSTGLVTINTQARMRGLKFDILYIYQSRTQGEQHSDTWMHPDAGLALLAIIPLASGHVDDISSLLDGKSCCMPRG
jgi:hypothetical protein